MGSVAVVGVEVGKLGCKYGCLYLIDATVVACVAEYIFLFRTVVA